MAVALRALSREEAAAGCAPAPPGGALEGRIKDFALGQGCVLAPDADAAEALAVSEPGTGTPPEVYVVLAAVLRPALSAPFPGAPASVGGTS